MTQKLFLASFLSVIVYSLIFLMLRGTIVFNAGLKIHFNPERRLRPHNETFEEYQRFVYSVARKMLWYVRPSLTYDPGLRPFCSGFRSVSSAFAINTAQATLTLLFSFHSCSSPFVHLAIDGYFWHRCVPWGYGNIVYIRAPRWCGDFPVSSLPQSNLRRRRDQRPDTFQCSQNLVPSYEIALFHRLRKRAFGESIHLASSERHEILFNIPVQSTKAGDEIGNPPGGRLIRLFPGKVSVPISQED